MGRGEEELVVSYKWLVVSDYVDLGSRATEHLINYSTEFL